MTSTALIRSKSAHPAAAAKSGQRAHDVIKTTTSPTTSTFKLSDNEQVGPHYRLRLTKNGDVCERRDHLTVETLRSWSRTPLSQTQNLIQQPAEHNAALTKPSSKFSTAGTKKLEPTRERLIVPPLMTSTEYFRQRQHSKQDDIELQFVAGFVNVVRPPLASSVGRIREKDRMRIKEKEERRIASQSARPKTAITRPVRQSSPQSRERKPPSDDNTSVTVFEHLNTAALTNGRRIIRIPTLQCLETTRSGASTASGFRSRDFLVGVDQLCNTPEVHDRTPDEQQRLDCSYRARSTSPLCDSPSKAPAATARTVAAPTLSPSPRQGYLSGSVDSISDQCNQNEVYRMYTSHLLKAPSSPPPSPQPHLVRSSQPKQRVVMVTSFPYCDETGKKVKNRLADMLYRRRLSAATVAALRDGNGKSTDKWQQFTNSSLECRQQWLWYRIRQQLVTADCCSSTGGGRLLQRSATFAGTGHVTSSHQRATAGLCRNGCTDPSDIEKSKGVRFIGRHLSGKGLLKRELGPVENDVQISSRRCPYICVNRPLPLLLH